jgi:DNA-binding NtrC family response regulator
MSAILLVDDDPLHASVRKAILERKFADVRRVGGASEALCLLEQTPIARDLQMVVTSDRLTEIDLPSFIAELHLRIPQVPVLVICDKDRCEEKRSSYSTRFLKRPVSADDLLVAAQNLLNSFGRLQLKTA